MPLTASGMEVGPSLYNLLLRMKKEGYRVENLPESAKELEKMIQAQEPYSECMQKAHLMNL